MAVDMRDEVDFIMQDINFTVENICLSKKQEQSKDVVHLNITTKESQKFCVELTCKGFRVVGNDHDLKDSRPEDDTQSFETVYALLESISPSYVNTFGNALASKLSKLENSKNDMEAMEVQESDSNG